MIQERAPQVPGKPPPEDTSVDQVVPHDAQLLFEDTPPELVVHDGLENSREPYDVEENSVAAVDAQNMSREVAVFWLYRRVTGWRGGGGG